MESIGPTQENEEEFSYGLLFKALTGGLYPNKYDVIREYIQNSCDAIKEWKHDHPYDDCEVQIKIDGSSIFIFDNATGMTREKTGQYRYLGFSKKRYGEYVGYRGIGSAAGITVADELIVTTSPYGVPDKYILTIRAGEMLRQIDEESKIGDVSTVKELMLKYSEVRTDREDAEAHYTTVELRGIRTDKEDSRALLDPSKLTVYLGTTVPVPFHPDFQDKRKNFGEEIDVRLREYVDDYMTFNIFINGDQIYKLYRAQWEHDGEKVTVKEPEYVLVYDPEGRTIAYCWYCQNMKSGQIDQKITYNGNEVDVGGLIFRLKGFAIGGKEYVRNTIWKYNSNFAYWSIGEIYVIDQRIEPTAERSGFVDNSAKIVFFEQCWTAIGSRLSRDTREKSAVLTAVARIDQAESVVKELQEKVTKGLDRQLLPTTELKLTEIVTDILKRKKQLEKIVEDEVRKRAEKKADDVISKAKSLINQLKQQSEAEQDNTKEEKRGSAQKKESRKQETVIVDVTNELGFDKETIAVYNSVIRALEDFFAGETEVFERVIVKINEQLRRDFGTP